MALKVEGLQRLIKYSWNGVVKPFVCIWENDAWQCGVNPSEIK